MTVSLSTQRVFFLTVIRIVVAPHHMQRILDSGGHFNKERFPGGERTPQICWILPYEEQIADSYQMYTLELGFISDAGWCQFLDAG